MALYQLDQNWKTGKLKKNYYSSKTDAISLRMKNCIEK